MSLADSNPCTFDLGWQCQGSMPSQEPCDSASAVATAVEQAVRMTIDMALQPVEALLAEIESTILDIMGSVQSNIEEQVATALSSVHDLHCRCGVSPCGAVWAVLVPWQQDSLRTLGLCPADSGIDVVSGFPVQATAEPLSAAVSPAAPGPAPCFFDQLSDRQLVSLLRSCLRALCCGTPNLAPTMPPAPEDFPPVPNEPSGQAPGAGLGESFPAPTAAAQQFDPTVLADVAPVYQGLTLDQLDRLNPSTPPDAYPDAPGSTAQV